MEETMPTPSSSQTKKQATGVGECEEDDLRDSRSLDMVSTITTLQASTQVHSCLMVLH